MTFPPPPPPAGYQVIRCLSERPGSWVFLACHPSSALVCLKLQQTSQPGSLARLARIREVLQELAGACPGLIPLTRWGQDAAAGVLWEEMPLADDLLTEAPPGEETADHYTPFTLQVRLQEPRRATTLEVLEGGIRLARAVELLHGRGLYHRDIKPANILRFRGEWVLADFGSVGEAGAQVDFPGTEGFVPPDGLGSPALDVFALGRTLYQWWTGHDLFRFPGLPAACLRAEDWNRRGWLLNRVIVRAGEPRPSLRYPTMPALRAALEEAREGRRRVSRRTWVLSGLAGAGGVGVAVLRGRRAPYRAVWRRRGPGRFAHEAWVGDGLLADWRTRQLYAARSEIQGLFIQRHHLDTHEHRVWRLPLGKESTLPAVLDLPGGRILVPEKVTGRIRRVDLEGGELPPWENQDPPDLQRTGQTYFNPLTGRLGLYGGYGDWACHNRRDEYDPAARRWLRMEDSGADRPWPRFGQIQFPNADRTRWYVWGGSGSRSGREFEDLPLRKDSSGKFYPLDDLWELDLRTGHWRNLLGVQKWRPSRPLAAVHHPGLGANLLLSTSGSSRPGSTTLHLAWPEPNRLPRALPNDGEYAKIHRLWSCLLEPDTHDLWLLSEQGIFTVSLAKV